MKKIFVVYRSPIEVKILLGYKVRREIFANFSKATEGEELRACQEEIGKKISPCGEFAAETHAVGGAPAASHVTKQMIIGQSSVHYLELFIDTFEHIRIIGGI